MKLCLALLAFTVNVSSEILSGDKMYWAVFGPIEVSTKTANVQKKSVQVQADNGDCYGLTVTPNGTLGAKWEACHE